MLRYSLRRILYMMPTVFGVVVITFVLFNVAGGDPAVMKLGKQATPKTLEEYDVQRGYNKPILLGRWAKTRAFDDTDFRKRAGAWGHVEGVRWENDGKPRLHLAEHRDYAVPLALPLVRNREYQWEFVYRTAGIREAGRGGNRIKIQ